MVDNLQVAIDNVFAFKFDRRFINFIIATKYTKFALLDANLLCCMLSETIQRV